MIDCEIEQPTYIEWEDVNGYIRLSEISRQQIRFMQLIYWQGKNKPAESSDARWAGILKFVERDI